MVYTHIPLSEFYELDRKLKKKEKGKKRHKEGNKRNYKEKKKKGHKREIKNEKERNEKTGAQFFILPALKPRAGTS